jgi:hypothetical protein
MTKIIEKIAKNIQIKPTHYGCNGRKWANTMHNNKAHALQK